MTDTKTATATAAAQDTEAAPGAGGTAAQTPVQTAQKPAQDAQTAKTPDQSDVPPRLLADAQKYKSEAKRYRLRLRDAQEQLTKVTASSTSQLSKLSLRADKAEKQVEQLTGQLQAQKEQADQQLHASQAAMVRLIITTANDLRIDHHTGRALPLSLQYKIESSSFAGPVIPHVADQHRGMPTRSIFDDAASGHVNQSQPSEPKAGSVIDRRALDDVLKDLAYDTPLPATHGKTMTAGDFYNPDGTLKPRTMDTAYSVIEGILAQHPYMRAQPAPIEHTAVPAIDGRSPQKHPHRESNLGQVTGQLNVTGYGY